MDLIDRLNNIGIMIHPFNKSLYHYTNLEAAKYILQDNTLKFSTGDELNDPFDMYKGLIDFSHSKKVTHKLADKLISERSKMLRQERRKLAKTITPEKYQEAMKNSLLQQRSNMGIFCLSKRQDKTLMWSHYGIKHTGICLGFNVFPTHKDYFSLCVNYVPTVQSIRYNQDSLEPNDLSSILLAIYKIPSLGI